MPAPRLLLLFAGLAVLGCKNKYQELKVSTADAGAAVAASPPEATLLAHGQNVPRDLQLDDTHLYWLNEGRRAEGEPGIFRVSKSGGAVERLVAGKGVHAIAVDAESVFWLQPDSDAVMRVPKSGGTPVAVASGQENLMAIAVDEGHVFWATREALWRADKRGGRPQSVASSISLPTSIAVDQASVYWYSDISGKLARAPKKGGGVRPVLSEELTLHAFFLDEGFLYWAFGSEKKAQIRRMPKAGGAPADVVSGQDVPADFATDEGFVYWTTGDAIFRAPKEGGPAVAVVSGTDRAHDIAVDGQFVYWTDRLGRVARMPK